MTAAEADLAAENARLRRALASAERERDEARAELDAGAAREAATGQILQTIAGASGDLQGVLDVVLRTAARLCAAETGVLRSVAGTRSWFSSFYGSTGAAPFARTAVEAARLYEHALDPRVPADYAILRQEVVQIAGTVAELRQRFPLLHVLAGQEGPQTRVHVPLLQAGMALGVLVLIRYTLEPFTDAQIALLQTFAAQAVIAIENTRLFQELQQSNASLRETLEQQTATAEILEIISSSPTDVQPVLRAVAQRAARLTDADTCNILQKDGDGLRTLVATFHDNVSDEGLGLPLTPHSVSGKAFLTRSTVHVPDIVALLETEFRDAVPSLAAAERLQTPYHTVLATPLLYEGEALGVLSLTHTEVRPFTDGQIRLLETFARQAAIAIHNVHLFQELQRSNAGLREALEQQTASAEILQAISASPTNPTRALDLITDSARRLVHADTAILLRIEGDHLAPVGRARPTGTIAIGATIPLRPQEPHGAAVLAGKTLHLPDLVAALDEFPILRRFVEAGGRSGLYVPLIHEGRAIGALSMGRMEQAAFTAAEIALAEAFASQAAIALENARLYGELANRNADLAEALEQQTATAEILGIISSSPTDLQPVFAAVAERAQRLLSADSGAVLLREGDGARVVAEVGATLSAVLNRPVPRSERLTEDAPFWQVVRGARTLHVHGSVEEIAGAYPRTAERWQAAGLARRAVVHAPLLHDGVALGIISAARNDGIPYTERQVALLETFAAQVVIAMQNTRLFDELQQSNASLRETLEQQTALAAVLQAISTSPSDPTRALDLIADSARRLTHADATNVIRFEGQEWQVIGNASNLLLNGTIDPESPVWPVCQTGRTMHFPDFPRAAVAEYPGLQTLVDRGRLAGLQVPLRQEGRLLGCLGIARFEERAFTPAEIALVETFASQAVIAIENERLYRELEQRNAQLEQASQYKSTFLSSMSHELRTPLNAVIGYSEMLQEQCEDEGYTDLVPDLVKINAAGKHLLSLISTVLDLAKIEAGKMDLVLEDFDVATLLAEVEAVVPPLMAKNGNQFVLQAEGELGSIHTDQTKLRQALLNLLSNAAKFTDHGTISLAVQREPREGGEWLRFAVSDTGIGMTEEQIGKLFGAFAQAEAGTSAKYGGSGLGLALSREFCRLLGGDISVTSEPGRGSTFIILVPATGGARG